jgi:hypothetical protein
VRFEPNYHSDGLPGRLPAALEKALSNNRIAEPLISALSRVQRWSAAFDYSLPRAQLRESLARCNAFQEDLRSYKLLFPPAKRPNEPQTATQADLSGSHRKQGTGGTVLPPRIDVLDF